MNVKYEIGKDYGIKGTYIGVRQYSKRKYILYYYCFINNIGQEWKEYFDYSSLEKCKN